MLSVCCLSGDPRRLAGLLPLVRPVADEVVVAVDDRADLRLLDSVAPLVDSLFVVPYADPPERSFQWLHEQTTGDWVFRIDDDEVPSPALLELLEQPPRDVDHVFVPRRWLWTDGWLAQYPWRPDWQLRLARREAVVFPGLMHVPVHGKGPARYVENAPLYHLDLLRADREARAAKARRYEPLRPGLRVGGLPLNVAYYLPEGRDLHVVPVPAQDRAHVDAVLHADPRPGREPAAFRVGREQIDASWGDRPLPDSAYRAALEPAPLEPFAAGEVRALDVRVTNLGSERWPHGPDGLPEIRLAYRGLPSALRTPLPHELGPGEAALVPVVIEAPPEGGHYHVTIDVVHERHRWFDCGVELELEVLPRRHAVVLVGQPPGDETFDRRVDELLASLDPMLEPVLVGPKPDWLRDRFGVAASGTVPAIRAHTVLALPAGRKRDRLLLEWRARRLRRHAQR